MLPLPSLFDVNVSLGWYIGLPTATWCIYLIDHLLDTQRNQLLNSPRHAFIKSYNSQILVLIILLLALCSYLAFAYYNIVLLLTAFTCVFFCIIYFLLTSIKNETFKFYYNKELLVACVYATALYFAIGLSQRGFGSWLLYYVALLLIAYINLLMISILEHTSDKENQQFSWVIIIGIKRATMLFKVLSYIIIIVCLLLTFINSNGLALLGIIYALMAFCHLLLFKYASKLKGNDLYRKLGEMIFWLPGLLLILI